MPALSRLVLPLALGAGLLAACGQGSDASAPVTPTASPSAVASSPVAASAGRDVATEEQNRRIVLDFYDRFFNKHETRQAAAVVADDYKQHNPSVPDGKKPFVEYFEGFFAEHPQSRVEIAHSATDGDLVVLHLHSVDDPGSRGQAVVDVFRVAGGTIVEHWDVVQDVPEQSANSNTMF